MTRRAPLSDEARAAVFDAYVEARAAFAGPLKVARVEVDPKLGDKRPRGRSIEEVARIVADAEEHGAASAARRHRLSASGVAAMAQKWRRHPVVAAAIDARRPAIEAKVRAKIEGHLGDLDAKVRRMLGG